MKIGISGVVSSGKTTLARALSRELAIELIPEGIREDLWKARNAQERAAVLIEMVDWKYARQLEHEDFVSDRSAPDLLLALVNRGDLIHLPQARLIYDKCRMMADQLDFLFILARDAIPFRQKSAADKFQRTANSLLVLRNDLLLRGLAFHLLGKDRVIEVPREVVDLGERVEFVKRVLSNG